MLLFQSVLKTTNIKPPGRCPGLFNIFDTKSSTVLGTPYRGHLAAETNSKYKTQMTVTF